MIVNLILIEVEIVVDELVFVIEVVLKEVEE